MKKLFIFLILLFTFTSGVVWSADLNKGMGAYHDGNYAVALLELKPLAEQGDLYAQSFLGLMYKNGKGVLKDIKEAIKWRKLAAE